MLLALGIGNTTITLGVFRAEELKATWRIATDSARMADEYGLMLSQMLELKSVPAAVPGIAFLSGGQSARQATENLNAMNALSRELPWELSFSYGRARQEPVLKAWGGRQENVSAAQGVFYRRAELNGAARTGVYRPDMED